MRVRLTRKLAERVDGIDLTGRRVGDVLELPDREALCLMSEGWAVLDASDGRELEGALEATVLPNGAPRRPRKRS